jgi:hypothetical protein
VFRVEIDVSGNKLSTDALVIDGQYLHRADVKHRKRLRYSVRKLDGQQYSESVGISLNKTASIYEKHCRFVIILLRKLF